MKKALIIILSFVIMVSFSVPVNARIEMPQKDISEYNFKSVYENQFNNTPFDVKAYKIETSDDGQLYYLIYFTSPDCVNEKYCNHIGDYYEISDVTNKWFKSGCAVYDFSKDRYFEWVENQEDGPNHWEEHFHLNPDNFYSFSDVAADDKLISAVIDCIRKNNLETRIGRAENIPTVQPTAISTCKDDKKANTMKVTVKTKNVKAKRLKKGKVTVTAITVKNAKGKLIYKKLSGSKKLTVTKKGKITVKKGTKKGTYRLKVKITAKGNSQYLEKSVTKTVKVRVK